MSWLESVVGRICLPPLLHVRALRLVAMLPLALLAAPHALAADAGAGKTPRPATERKVALVIGNAAYPKAPLRNPINDAQAVRNTLAELGFDVVYRENLRTPQIGAALREFRGRSLQATVALFYFAGHGVQLRKADNYFLMVDADIGSEDDIPFQSLELKHVFDVLEESRARVNLVVLDACRDNPFLPTTRSLDKGLARATPPAGTLMVYATRPGDVASDGAGRNGLFTSKMIRRLREPDIPVEQTFKRIAADVREDSKGRQDPLVEGTLHEDFAFSTRGAGPATGAAPAGAAASREDVLRLQQELAALRAELARSSAAGVGPRTEGGAGAPSAGAPPPARPAPAPVPDVAALSSSEPTPSREAPAAVPGVSVVSRLVDTLLVAGGGFPLTTALADVAQGRLKVDDVEAIRDIERGFHLLNRYNAIAFGIDAGRPGLTVARAVDRRFQGIARKSALDMCNNSAPGRTCFVVYQSGSPDRIGLSAWLQAVQRDAANQPPRYWAALVERLRGLKLPPGSVGGNSSVELLN